MKDSMDWLLTTGFSEDTAGQLGLWTELGMVGPLITTCFKVHVVEIAARITMETAAVTWSWLQLGARRPQHFAIFLCVVLCPYCFLADVRPSPNAV